jgi:hypothetical protein
MHRHFDIPVLDILLMVLGPPLLGAAIGLLLSLGRRRPGRAALGGLAGATAGAWAGLACYRSVFLPVGRDLLIFDACVLGGLLLGAVPLAWLLAGPKAAAAGERVSVRTPTYRSGWIVVIAGLLLACVGFFPYQMGSEASAHMPVSDEVKDAGILLMLGGLGTVVLGLLWARRQRETGSGYPYNWILPLAVATCLLSYFVIWPWWRDRHDASIVDALLADLAIASKEIDQAMAAAPEPPGLADVERLQQLNTKSGELMRRIAGLKEMPLLLKEDRYRQFQEGVNRYFDAVIRMQKRMEKMERKKERPRRAD